MAWFRNHYKCDRCNQEWVDEWFAACEDDCPFCGVGHMTPYKSEETPAPRNGNAQEIAELNDAFRKTFRGGKVIMTAGVDALPEVLKTHALLEVSNFSRFTPDNDPHGERDFGSFGLGDRTFFWKIDYYDKSLRCGSENPADPNKTTRVLTLMLASEY